MPQPYSEVLNHEWAKKQNFTDVVWGDEIFEIVQLGAKRLESSWENLSSPWERLIEKAVETGFLGFGDPLMAPERLSFLIFTQEKNWPKGLTPKDKRLLRLARAVSEYTPGKDLSLSEIMSYRANPKGPNIPQASPEESLQALKRYIALFEKKIALPMWDALSKTSKQMAPKIMRACEKVYGEACGMQESREIFYGDMDRAWKAETLKISPTTYKVYGVMNDYIMLEAGGSDPK